MIDLKKEVLIRVNTIQKDEEGKSDISAIYNGVMYMKSGAILLFYSEFSEDGEKTADCRIKLSDTSVEIKRSGAYSSRLIFEQGKVYKTVYNTPYGQLPVVVKTAKVISAVDEFGGKVLLDYKMDIAGRKFINSVSIRIELVTKGINNEI